ncbi:MAG: hypothetical protein IMF14_07685, partial [Proteobacteria bacterium]|nr:hypothetical protein [Pseudomonadota bacterium]
KIAIILAEDELQQSQVTIKYLREKREQQSVAFDQLAAFISAL